MDETQVCTLPEISEYLRKINILLSETFIYLFIYGDNSFKFQVNIQTTSKDYSIIIDQV